MNWVGSRTISILAGLIALSAAIAAATGAATALERDIRTVLILASEDSLLPANRVVTDTLSAKLRTAIPEDLSIFTEFMDISRETRRDAAQILTQQLGAKYRNKGLDLVIALGPQALQLLHPENDTLFKDVPVLFVAVGAANPALASLPPGVGGVTMEFSIKETVELARTLQPNLKSIAIVTGSSEFDHAWRRTAAAELAAYNGEIEIIDLADLPVASLIDRLDKMSADTAILYLTIFQDGTGSTYIPRDLVSRIAAAARGPVYGLYSTYVGEGIVGGYMSSFDTQADSVAGTALSILSGSLDPRDLNVTKVSATPHVDWRMLQKWHLDDARLPAGTSVHFRTLSLWEAHREMILGFGIALLLQTAMIVALLSQRKRRKVAEGSLQRVNEHMDVAVSSANFGLWSWTPAANRVWQSPHCRSMTGTGDEPQIDFDRFLVGIAGVGAELVRADLLKAIKKSELFQRELPVTDATGVARWLLLTGYCMRHGQERYMTGTVVDVNERKLAQLEAERQRQQVIHLTRVTTLGEISGALAHELNQPLTAILTNAQTAQRLIARKPADPEQLDEILADIVQDDQRAGAVIARLRMLARKQEFDLSSINLNQIATEVLTLLHTDLIDRQVHVVTSFAEAIPTVRGDPIQIQQVLLNLIRNACDATSRNATRDQRIVVETGWAGNDSLAVTVRDNGIGLPADFSDRIFDPFFTTKADGMGLGLAICRSILTAHGGKIWHNNRGEGTEFSFSLPVVEGGRAWAP